MSVAVEWSSLDEGPAEDQDALVDVAGEPGLISSSAAGDTSVGS